MIADVKKFIHGLPEKKQNWRYWHQKGYRLRQIKMEIVENDG